MCSNGNWPEGWGQVGYNPYFPKPTPPPPPVEKEYWTPLVVDGVQYLISYFRWAKLDDETLKKLVQNRDNYSNGPAEPFIRNDGWGGQEYYTEFGRIEIWKKIPAYSE